jgi:integrase
MLTLTRGEFDKTGRELVTPLPPEAVQAIREAAPDVLSPWLIPSDTDPSRPVSRSVLNDWMQKVKERAGVDVDRLGFHAYKRAGIRTKEFRALPPKVQEQLTGTTHAMLSRVLKKWSYAGPESKHRFKKSSERCPDHARSACSHLFAPKSGLPRLVASLTRTLRP